MFEVHFQVLCPEKFLSLDPKMQNNQLMVFAGNIISDPCCLAQKSSFTLHCELSNLADSSSQILLGFCWLYLRIIPTAI